MLSAVQSGRFKRDAKRMEKRGKEMIKLRKAVTLLLSEEKVPAEYRDHALRGLWQHYRELHIEPDWLLIYRVEGSELSLARTGTHSDLFHE
jgi:mRNA interferase YafQ